MATFRNHATPCLWVTSLPLHSGVFFLAVPSRAVLQSALAPRLPGARSLDGRLEPTSVRWAGGAELSLKEGRGARAGL